MSKKKNEAASVPERNEAEEKPVEEKKHWWEKIPRGVKIGVGVATGVVAAIGVHTITSAIEGIFHQDEVNWDDPCDGCEGDCSACVIGDQKEQDETSEEESS